MTDKPLKTQGLRRLTRQDSVNQKQRLNKTQEGLNETVRIQRDDSMNKLNQSKTSLNEGETLKPREVETEEARLDKRWPKLKMRSSSKEDEGRNKKECLKDSEGRN